VPGFLSLLTLAVLAVLLSTLSAISGLGGGIFLIPLMILFFDLPLKYLAGTMLLAMVPFTAVATFKNIQNKYVNFRVGLLLQSGAIVGVIIGSHYAAIFPNYVLKALFVSVVLYLLISLQQKEKSEYNLATQLFLVFNHLPPHITINELPIKGISLSAIVILGFIAGFFSGLLGIGGGFVIVPLFIVGMKLPAKIAVGTSLFMILITSSVGAVHHAILQHIQYQLSFVLAFGMIIGAAIGSNLLKRISEKKLKKVISLILVLAVVGVILR
jgi:uncharacterized protein